MDVNEVRGGRIFGAITYSSTSGQSVAGAMVHSERRHNLCGINERLRDCNHKGDALECGLQGYLLNYQRAHISKSLKSLKNLDRSKVNTECLQWQQ
jgi:hypothetical protein